MTLDDGARDGQPQPRAPLEAGITGINLGEALKDQRAKALVHAWTTIQHFDAQAVRLALQHHFDITAGRGELAGIGQQIAEHLLDAIRVNLQRRNRRHRHRMLAHCHPYAEASSKALYRRHRTFNQRRNFRGLHIEGQTAGGNTLTIEDVIHQPHQTITVGAGDIHQLARLVRQPTHHPTGQQSQRTADRSHGRA